MSEDQTPPATKPLAVLEKDAEALKCSTSIVHQTFKRFGAVDHVRLGVSDLQALLIAAFDMGWDLGADHKETTEIAARYGAAGYKHKARA